MSPSPLVFGATVPSHPSPSCRGRGNARGRAVGHGGHHVLGGHPGGTGPRRDGETELQCFARRRDVSGARPSGFLGHGAAGVSSRGAMDRHPLFWGGQDKKRKENIVYVERIRA